jgi:oligosaccharide repeat unit polymerase
MLFPLFALTGLKFVFPELVSFPIYVTKEELTTVTLFYDAYYDFGIAGVAVFALILGAAAALLEHLVAREGRRLPVLYVFWAQFCFYLLFAFFTTWYSNPATWFYYGMTLLCLFIMASGSRRRRRRR